MINLIPKLTNEIILKKIPNSMRKIILCLCLCSFCLTINAQPLAEAEVPTPVKSAFAIKYNSIKPEWSKSGDDFVATYPINNHIKEYCYITSSGLIRSTDTYKTLDPTNVNENIREYLKKQQKGAIVHKYYAIRQNLYWAREQHDDGSPDTYKPVNNEQYFYRVYYYLKKSPQKIHSRLFKAKLSVGSTAKDFADLNSHESSPSNTNTPSSRENNTITNNINKEEISSAKNDGKEVSLVVSGDGDTKSAATAMALRSAIERAFGTFVSANTTILNDELVKDEIVSITTGNIKKYDELSSIIMPNGKISVTLKAVVSINNLVSYVQNHGGQTELAGKEFAMQMKLEKFNVENEKIALDNMKKQLLSLAPKLFNYSIETESPKMVSTEFAEIPMHVSINASENTELFNDIVKKTLGSLSVSPDANIPNKTPIITKEFNNDFYWRTGIDNRTDNDKSKEIYYLRNRDYFLEIWKNIRDSYDKYYYAYIITTQNTNEKLVFFTQIRSQKSIHLSYESNFWYLMSSVEPVVSAKYSYPCDDILWSHLSNSGAKAFETRRTIYSDSRSENTLCLFPLKGESCLAIDLVLRLPIDMIENIETINISPYPIKTLNQ